jgi:phage tail-like protein
MDANGLRFWLLGDRRHWRATSHALWDEECHVLRLASERSLPPPANRGVAHAAANSALEAVPRCIDGQGAVAYWNVSESAVVSRSYLPDEAALLPLPATPGDIAIGFDGILYCALADAICMHDLRGRWADIVVPTAGFAPWRLAADPAGGVWALERATGRLARLSGAPLPLGPYVDYAGTVFRPDPENCHPPTLRILPAPAWPSDEHPLAPACNGDGALALLSWFGDGEARLRLYDTAAERLGPPLVLVGARYAYAFDWVDAGRIVVRMPGRRDAPAFDLGAADTYGHIVPAGEIYPLAGAEEAPFAHRLDGPPQYPVVLAEGVRGTEPLFRLSLANLARQGEARNYADGDAHLIDSGSLQTIWHRLYAEAQLPPRTGFVVWLAATAEPEAPAADAADAWSPHRFGETAETGPHTARATWERAPSELPNHPGLGPWEHQPGRAGLLSVLIQNPRRRVRALVGRYLWVRVELSGDGRVGPQIAALRAYANRFSYRDQYLPRLYRETVFGDPALLPGEVVAKLPTSLRSSLDAGGLAGGGLLDGLNAAGLNLGAASRISVERAGQSWLLQDGSGSRAWRLRGDADGIRVFQPQATPADFLERMLDNFEGLLTPLEDRIANAHLLTDPSCTADDNLDWIGSWIGIAFDPALPHERRRTWLAAAPYLARLHGTKAGLQLALDIASGGGVRSGAIIVLEDFRLRRILATLLGVDLSDDQDPLLPGLVISGNSVVGDTLTLGERAGVELLALFRNELASSQENADVIAFLDRLANRATVLVHQEVSRQDLALLRRVVELEAPAHVLTRVVTAAWPFLVGIASLVGVDTYLGPPQTPRPARVNRSSLGQDYVIGPVSLDPRLSGAAAPAPPQMPTADAGIDRSVPFATSFMLDGSNSRAAPGQSLSDYIWRRLPQI